MMFPSFESATAKVSPSQLAFRNLRRPLLGVPSRSLATASRASEVLSNLSKALSFTICNQQHQSVSYYTEDKSQRTIYIQKQKNHTFRADSAEENTLPKSYKTRIVLDKQRRYNKKEKKLEKVEMVITSTLDSFPSSNTLNTAKPAGVSNSRSIVASSIQHLKKIRKKAN